MRLLPVALAACLAIAAPASAAVRYVSPTSADASGSCASAAAACTLTHGVNDGAANGEVVVLPGSYSVTATLALKAGSYIHGQAGAARPVIHTTAASTGLSTTTPGGAHIQDLELDGPSTNGLVFLNDAGALVENVVLHATGANGIAFAEYGISGTATIRDSVATASGTNAIALWFGGSTAHARNVTAWATGSGSTGVLSYSNFSTLGMSCIGQGHGQVDLVSSIAHGEGKDLQVTKAGNCGPLPALAASYSDFQTKGETGATIDTSGGHNVALAPAAVFVDLGTDFHELTGAATIDAGHADASTGTHDVDDLARVRETIDMGAAEYFAPAVLLSPTSAGPTFNGTVGPNGLATTAFFEFGPDASYGSTSDPIAVPADTSLHAVSAAPAGLDPAKTYHVRLVASQGNANYTRTVRSADGTYTPPAPAQPGAQPTGDPAVTPTPTPTKAARFSDLAGLPSAKRCVGRHGRLRLRLRRLAGTTIASVRLKVTGRKARTVRGKALSRPIYIGHPRTGRFTVTVTLRTSSGKTLTAKRRYRAC